MPWYLLGGAECAVGVSQSRSDRGGGSWIYPKASRGSDSRSDTLSDLEPHTFMTKLGRQTDRCALTLRFLQAANVSPMETTVPHAAAVNPSTIRPETSEELRARESIPDSPHRDGTPPTEHPPHPVCSAMVQKLAGVASINTVPEAQRPTLLTIFQHECVVQMLCMNTTAAWNTIYVPLRVVLRHQTV